MKIIRNFFSEDYYSKLRSICNNIKRIAMDEHEEMYHLAFDYVNELKIKGDYLEFGCFSGKTMTCAYKAAKNVKMSETRFFAFDSFQGLPELNEIDKVIPQFESGQYATSEKDFYSDLRHGGVDIKRVKTIPGWFHETLKNELHDKLNIRRAAVIMIDCDLYESTVPVLNFITKYLDTGSVILFDDWYCFGASPNFGQQKACKEWLEKNHQIGLTKYLPFEGFGQSFIVYKK